MQRIKKETAKLLKEKTSDFKDYEGDFYEDEFSDYPTPYQEEVIEWLWEKHKIHIHVTLCYYNDKPIFYYVIKGDIKKDVISAEHSFDDRNEAIEQGIIQALELIK